MKKIFVIPNIITAFGLACGLFVIFKVSMIDHDAAFFKIINTATLLLLVAAVADFVDGAVARALHAESEFGVLFDSLADAISFGVAPSVLMLKSLSLTPGTPLSFFLATSAMVFSLCGILRLVRFNIKAAEAKGNEELMAAQKKHFTGLPIPAGAAGIASLNLFCLSNFSKNLFNLDPNTIAIIEGSMAIVLGYLMVCQWKFPSLKALHIRLPSFQLAFLTVVIATFIFYGLLYFFPIAFIVTSWAYIIVGLILSLIRFIAGKKSKTLEDFEPEPDELEEDLEQRG